MSIIACSIDGCERVPIARGLCNKHYKAARRRGVLSDHAIQERTAQTACSVDGCEGEFVARGWCDIHYRRWQRTGSIETSRFNNKKTCSVDGCEKAAKARTWCNAHYRRWRLTGETGDGALKTYRTPTAAGQRLCSDCREWLPLDCYTMNSHKTGPKSICRDCERVRNIAWREANPTYWQEWQKDNAQVVRDIANRRRAAKFSREHEKIDRDVVFERDGYLCKLCGLPLDMDAKFPHPLSPTLDHIIPINKGGHHLYTNLQAAHFRCNTAKGDRILTDGAPA